MRKHAAGVTDSGECEGGRLGLPGYRGAPMLKTRNNSIILLNV